MNTPTKLGAYLAGLAVVFAAALGVGTAVGPVGPAADETSRHGDSGTDHGDMDMSDGSGAHE